MCWKGYSLYSCTAEFRLFWLQTKLAEAGLGGPPEPMGAGPGPGPGQGPGGQPTQARRIAPLPAYRASPGGLLAAHSGAVGFVRDGLSILHREGRYEAGRGTPLALLWKDAACSRYLLETDAAGEGAPRGRGGDQGRPWRRAARTA